MFPNNVQPETEVPELKLIAEGGKVMSVGYIRLYINVDKL